MCLLSQEAFHTLPSTYGLFDSSPAYGLFEVAGKPLLVVSCNVVPSQNTSKVLLMGAAVGMGVDTTTQGNCHKI